MFDEDARSQLWKLIENTKFCMLTHRHGDGRLHSQPLTTQNKELDAGATLYFFVQKDGELARHVSSDPNVNVAYANIDDDDYVSISGSATFSADRLMKERLFNTIAKAWFPGGVDDRAGPKRSIPTGDALLAAGTANQTKLLGGPAKGAVYEFAPAVDQYLKSHLFGAIFERDNFDWQSRELATVGMLSALPGADAQLQAHMGFSMNVGITASQLTQVTQVLADKVDAEPARQAREALARQLASRTKR